MTPSLIKPEEALNPCSVLRCQTVSQRLIPVLTGFGVTAALVTFLAFREAAVAQAQPDQLVQTNVAKSGLYYFAHALEISLLLSAGVLSFFSIESRNIRRGYLLRFMLMIAAAVFMARVYSIPDLASSKLFDATGPIPFVLSVLVFVGARQSNWIFLSKVMGIAALVFSLLTLFGIAQLQSFTRIEGVQKLMTSLNNLYWPASWIALRQYERSSPWRHFRLVPIAIYTLGSFFTQTRLNFVMIVALIGVFSYLQYRRRKPQVAGLIGTIVLIGWVALFTVIFLRNSRVFDRLDSVAAAFSSRMDEDTRTGQLVSFFEDVHPQELILGRGSFASWYWGGDYSGGTDVGYLTLLFYGGVPLLLTYFVTHVRPCLAILRSRRPNWQLTAAGVVFLWGIRLSSSDYPSMSIGNYLVLFCIGACISNDYLEGARYFRKRTSK